MTEAQPSLLIPQIGTIKAPAAWIPREDQLEIFAKIEKAFKSGKKVVAVQGPTGSGKSLVGIATALAFEKSYYLVPLKSLQDQVENDFRDFVSPFKGKANYTCAEFTKPDDTHYSVDEAPCQDRDQAEQRRFCKQNSICSYYNAQKAAAEGQIALMNFMLYLCWMRIRNETPTAPFQKRSLHIIDEAHRIEGTVRDFITVDLSSERLEKYLQIREFPGPNSTKEQYVSFLKKVDVRNKEEIAQLQKTFGENLQAVSAEIGSDKLDYHNALSDKLKIFFENEGNYSFGFEERFHGHLRKMVNYMVVKPLYVGGFIRQNVLGEHTLILSATLPKKSVNALGFEDDEFEYIEMPSRFPAANRLIKFANVGRINKENSERLIPKMVEKVNFVLDRHKNSKGIIHAPSYRVAELLMAGMEQADSPHTSRILMQTREPGSAKYLLEKHAALEGVPTILLSPGMKEGIDLKGELSRVQIIIKAPYPNLGDPAVKELSERDHSWYITQTIVDFMQMYGRSIRSADDYAETICLDDNIRILLKDYKMWIPKYVMEAVRWVG